MAIVDIFVSGDGSDGNNGSSYPQRVQTFTRARQLAAAVGSGNVPCFVVGQFDMSLQGAAGQPAWSQRIGTGIDAFNVPDGWSMRAHDASLPWHFRDHRILSQAADFRQVHTTGAGAYNLQLDGRTVPGVTDNGGTPTGTPTGIWAVTCSTSSIPIVAGVQNAGLKVDRVWRGAAPATLGSASAFLSSMDPYNEVWEARDFSTLGQDPTHVWTQLVPSETWRGDATPGTVFNAANTNGPVSNVIFIWTGSTTKSPFHLWGGITVQALRGTFLGNGRDFSGLLDVENSNGWKIDSSVRFLGGAYGALHIVGNCSGWTAEPTVVVSQWSYPTVSFHKPNDTGNNNFSNFVLAPRIDMLVRHKPYYPIDASHAEGNCDVIQLLAGANFTNGRIAAFTSAGESCFVRDPGHSAVGCKNAGTGANIDGLVIESGFAVRCGNMQYQRAFVFNGPNVTGSTTAPNIRRVVVSGQVFDQSVPTQINGDVRVVGLHFHNQNPLVDAAPEYPSSGATGYLEGRFSAGANVPTQRRNFANVHPNGKNRDAVMLSMNITGRQEVIGCTFNGTHGVGLMAATVANSGGGANFTPDDATQSLVVADNVFVAKNDPHSERAAVCVDARAAAGGGMHFIGNRLVGYPAGGGAQHIETNGYYRFNGPVESLGDPLVVGSGSTKGGDGAGVRENVGWQRLV